MYLILHKVRGEPAFDIADKVQIGDEEGWIIPTSGHRAYPYWHLLLEHAAPQAPMDLPIPDDWPDHYQTIDLPARKGNGQKIDIMSIIGPTLAKNFKRRI